MTQQFMADATIQELYGFSVGAVFEDTFSAVSLESIWFSIVASAIYVLESLFDAFRADVDAKIAGAVVASIPWYHKICLEFQYGDSLVYDEETQGFVYPVIDTTKQLAAIIENALSHLHPKERKEAVKKSCQRCFQALRIDVNSEFEVLYDFLEKLPGTLKSGGRVAVLTFHSGEDRLVKKAFKQYLREGIYSEIAEDVIRPSAEECFRNPRAKSTKMRWAIKA